MSLFISYSLWFSQLSSDALSLLLSSRLSRLEADRSVLTSVHVTTVGGTARFSSTTHQRTPTILRNVTPFRKLSLVHTGKRQCSPQNRPRKPRFGVEVQICSFFNFGTRWGSDQRHVPTALSPEMPW